MMAQIHSDEFYVCAYYLCAYLSAIFIDTVTKLNGLSIMTVLGIMCNRDRTLRRGNFRRGTLRRGTFRREDTSP